MPPVNLQQQIYILSKNQELRELCLDIAWYMETASVSVTQSISVYTIGLDSLIEELEKHKRIRGDEIPAYYPFLRWLPHTIYLMMYAGTHIFSQHLWTDERNRLIYQLLSQNPRYILDNEEQLNKIIAALTTTKNTLKHYSRGLLGANIVNDIYRYFYNDHEINQRTWMNTLYNGYAYILNGGTLLIPKHQEKKSEIIVNFTKAYESVFGRKINTSKPYICSNNNNIFDTTLCFTVTEAKPHTDLKASGLVMRAFCQQSVAFYAKTSFCATVELPFNYFTGNSLSEEKMKQQLRKAWAEANSVIDFINTLGELPSGFISPLDHQENFDLLIITDPLYLIKPEFDFVVQRGNDCVINLRTLTAEQKLQLQNTLNPKKTKKEIGSSSTASSSKNDESDQTFYSSHNPFSILHDYSTRNKSSGKRSTLDNLTANPRLGDFFVTEKKAPIWDDNNYQYQEETDMRLETVAGNKRVESHVYIRLPADNHDYDEYNKLCTQDMDMHNGFKALVIGSEHCGCFEIHDHSKFRYLAYVKSWGWQETVINGKTEQKRVLLVELDLSRQFTHEQIRNINPKEHKKIQDSAEIYNTGSGFKNVKKKKKK